MKIEKDRVVRFHYSVAEVGQPAIETSKDREPIAILIGHGNIIPGLEAAMQDKAAGEKFAVDVPAAEAYGERDEAMVQQVPVDQIPNGDQLPVGQTVYMMGPGGQPFPVFVRSIEDGIATFDMNHELAGKDLNFEITLVEVAE